MRRQRFSARGFFTRARTTGLILGLGYVAATVALQPTAVARFEPGVYDVIYPDSVYTGNNSCSGSDCHTAEKPTMQSGQQIGNEASIWLEYDPHAQTFEQLETDKSRTIAKKLGIDNPRSSDRCLECHAMNVPKKNRGEKFALKQGAVGCEACHGPAKKWLEPHAKKGWTNSKRKKIGSKGLLEQFRLVDTTDLSARAHTCVACHLQIDKDMIDAGHPKLEFELYGYTYYAYTDADRKLFTHWKEGQGQDKGKMRDAKIWAAGQIAALQAARAQVKDWKQQGWETKEAESLRDLYAAGVEIVKNCFGAETANAVDAMDLTPAQGAKAVKQLAKLTEQASNPRERRIVAYGVAGVGSAVFSGRGESVPDAFWNAYNTARTGEAGQAYQDAVQKMASLAQP